MITWYLFISVDFLIRKNIQAQLRGVFIQSHILKGWLSKLIYDIAS